MSLVAEKGTFASNTTTGNQTVNLGSAFDSILPKFVILWTTGQTSADTNDVDVQFSIGCGTFDGGAVQHWYQSMFADSGTDPSAVVRGRNVSAILKPFTSDSTTPDAEYDLVSLNSGTPSNFVVNVVDAPATAIVIHYLVVGGTDISAARCGSFSALNTGTPPVGQDITVNTGFGQPDFLFFSTAATNSSDVQGNSLFGFSMAKDETNHHSGVFNISDASAAVTIVHFQKPNAIFGTSATGTIDFEADLDAKANWPTDGFRLLYSDIAGSAYTNQCYLALKGTFQSACGSNSTLTAGSTQDNACGFVPVVAGVWGGNQATSATVINSGTGFGGWGFGATDFTNEGWAGVTADDAQTANTRYDRRYSTTKTLVEMTPETPTVEAEADASVSGTNFRLTYSDLDSANREYAWWALGEAPAAPNFLFLGPTTAYR